MNQDPAKKRFPASPASMFGMVSSDIIEDVLVDLAKENEQSLANLSEYAGSFKDPRVIEIIFLLSEYWGQDSSTKYQAVEILDRFMILHVEEVYKSSAEYRNIMERSQAEPWNSLKIRLCDTFMLHLASCVLIASKLYFHCHIVDYNIALKFFGSAGYAYTKAELLRSELTVLRTLDFRVNLLSPFSYVEMLLEVLGHNNCSLSLKSLREMCIMILDLVYLVRNIIYDMILKTSTDLQSPTALQRIKFLPVKEDQMLLAASVISAGAFILGHDSWNQVLDHLHCITGITVNSLFDMSSAILKHSIGTAMLPKH
ncbi:cyclin N-terminal domain-containing protein 1 [Xenopus laevis]|uniref:Cyclin N-terminal domain-containing protein 1 n=1 Tax=Xenopus laevis TaxID=8355 RepID=A0A8J1LV27_XENLA|nr:cyclin N-terminal domain-containing protein 1 [Xenopus laevis]XP_041432580.1 cyclin N-terminal domain-containing protein 1 [Xenopus laevis]XP_041432581.1 cyclin N-terminal domain-containing protein 1 [Xenopus laevis]XP_041432582.1 cyclin N-terminal domain-containing protein 1 [Xenopus laevis]